MSSDGDGYGEKDYYGSGYYFLKKVITKGNGCVITFCKKIKLFFESNIRIGEYKQYCNKKKGDK